MTLFSVLACAVALQGQTTEKRVFPIKRVSALYLLKCFAVDAYPPLAALPDIDPAKGVRWSAVPSVLLTCPPDLRAIVAEGPLSDVNEIARWIPLFDVAPSEVWIEIRCKVPELGYSRVWTVHLLERSSLEFREEAFDLQATIRTRANGDGTVTLAGEMKRKGKVVPWIGRIAAGQSLYVKPPWIGYGKGVKEPTKDELYLMGPENRNPNRRSGRAGNPDPKLDPPDLGAVLWIVLEKVVEPPKAAVG